MEHYFDDYNTNNGNLPDATWELYDRSDICIETRSEETIDTPFVVNLRGECGLPAEHMHLTADYFLNKNHIELSYGSYENVLIHEWAHFRYGVFDEHPHKTLENNEEFYLNSNGEIEATRCNKNYLTGQLKNPLSLTNGECEDFTENGLPSTDCIFVDDIVAKNESNRIASLMYRPFVQQLNEFCDNDLNSPKTLHNKIAPTLQNKQCKGKSVWEVLRTHEDFKDIKNVDFSTATNHTIPKFKLIKRRHKRIILLIDESIKRKSYEKFIKLKTVRKLICIQFLLIFSNLIKFQIIKGCQRLY
jgi:calcium-activated chloride channel regulator 3/4